MNKTEAAYAAQLETLRAAGEILGWWFEPMSIRLAEDARYTPDFLVAHPTHFQVVEIKGGFAREASRVRWKVAAETYPVFRWTWAVGRRRNGSWHWEETDYGK